MDTIKIHCRHDEMMEIAELLKRQNPKNRNKHPRGQVLRLAEIYQYNGVRQPIVISERSNQIVKGHGRLLAAIECKMQSFPIEWQKYDTEDKEYADSVADNAIALWAELDLAGINTDIPELHLPSIDLLGIKDFQLEPADKYADKDADEVPEVKETNIKRGDLFQLGNHRLLCGDATNKEDVERLMNGEKADLVYTDPPYGMNLDTDYSKRKGKKYRPVIGDDKPFDPAHIFEMFGYCDEIFLWGGDYYAKRLPDGGSWIVWDKTEKINADHYDHNTLQDSGFASSFELCWSKSPHKRYLEKLLWRGVYGEGKDEERTFAGGHIDRKHPTQKPILLIERQLNRFAKDKTNIVDLYGGSGSTLIACEKTAKRCFMSEIDPQYCQVIIDRWEKFTGQTAELIGKSDESAVN